MKYPKFGLALCLVAGSLSLSACVDDGYGYGVGSAGYYPSYSGWYDGYYGSIYDGYWGNDDYFYYRRSRGDHYRRGDRDHFYRGDRAPNDRFRRFEGRTRHHSGSIQRPNYPRVERSNRDRSFSDIKRGVERRVDNRRDYSRDDRSGNNDGRGRGFQGRRGSDDDNSGQHHGRRGHRD